jgi:hypothetical protein
VDDADVRQWYIPNDDRRSDNCGDWRSTTEDEVPDHEAVENLLRSSVEIAEFSNSMGKINEGENSDRNEEDDDKSMRSEDQGLSAVQKGGRGSV